ncbi:TRAP transporter small permease [Ruegeria atlantica]|uniref:TRAP transporter small permease n=1 Tax=Ruegeria atlantica TaxID=81569 RepID=UPI00148103FD|nr:TRAP transporter small permease [Ruegeria atlantica]
MTRYFVRFVDNLCIVELALSAAIACLIGMLVFASAVTRYFFSIPLGFTDELVTLSSVLSSLFAMPYAARAGKNISLDFLTSRLSAEMQSNFHRIALMATILVVGIFAFYSLEDISYSLHYREVSEVNEIPIAPIKVLSLIALTSFELALISNLLTGEFLTPWPNDHYSQNEPRK